MEATKARDRTMCRYPRKQTNIVYYNQCEDLAILLEVGDHFVVLKSHKNEDGEDYYIAVCKQATTILKELVRDGLGTCLTLVS